MKGREQQTDRELILVYDHQCPVCDAYCRQIRVRPEAGRLHLMDARSPGEIRDEVTRRGWDIDQGMVLHAGGQLHYGADAIHELSLLADKTHPFNLLNYLAFRWKWAANLLYPLLQFFRNLLLKLLGRTKINNLSLPHNETF